MSLHNLALYVVTKWLGKQEKVDQKSSPPLAGRESASPLLKFATSLYFETVWPQGALLPEVKDKDKLPLRLSSIKRRLRPVSVSVSTSSPLITGSTMPD